MVTDAPLNQPNSTHLRTKCAEVELKNARPWRKAKKEEEKEEKKEAKEEKKEAKAKADAEPQSRNPAAGRAPPVLKVLKGKAGKEQKAAAKAGYMVGCCTAG